MTSNNGAHVRCAWSKTGLDEAFHSNPRVRETLAGGAKTGVRALHVAN